MQWMVPERRLDDYQLEILRKCGVLRGRNQLIQGFAGSGKSVLVIHAIQRILAENPNAKVCVAVYTHALKQLLTSGLAEKYRKVPVQTYHQLLNSRRHGNGVHYDVLVIDEVQDVPPDALVELKSIADRLIVAGDADQSIYERSGSPAELVKIIEPEIYKLTTIHRLTKRLIEIVRTILPGSAIEGTRTARMQEVQVTLAKAESDPHETNWVWNQCCRYSKAGEPSAVLFSSHSDVQSFLTAIASIESVPTPTFYNQPGDKQHNYELANRHFRQHEVPLRYLGNNFGSLEESDARPITYVMTYHSAKGLDFNTVFIPRLNQGLHIWRDNENIARRLFFVAATRSRRNLFLSYSSSEPHAYVKNMPQNLLHREACPSGDDTASFDHDVPF
jgi:superfamily I DNA/RNA helicase